MVTKHRVLRGYHLEPLEKRHDETVFRAVRDDRLYCVRQAPVAQSARLAWECAVLQRLSHSLLPEFVEYFSEGDQVYLVTRTWDSPAKSRRDLAEAELFCWGRQLFDLQRYLQAANIYLDVVPEDLVALPGGLLRLVHLRGTQRSPGHPNYQHDPHPTMTDQKALGACLSHWFGQTPSSELQMIVQSLTQGNFLGSLQSFSPAGLGEEARILITADSTRTCLPPGTRIGGYEVEFLAEGGMSVCYKGRSGHHLRFIKEVDSRDTKSAVALRREYEFLRVLQHPNIVRCHQAFEQGGNIYLVMDFVEGASLEDLSSRADYVPPAEEQLLRWADVLCNVLAYLHSCSTPIIYRDLKPGNVILNSQGQLRLIDFGIARTYKAGSQKDTEALGTVMTASPEHFYGQTNIKSDLYCLGATIYLMAAPDYRPAVPFNWLPLCQVNPAYSPAFSDLLADCLRPDPNFRWADAATLSMEIRRQLQAFAGGPSPTIRLRENFQIGDLRSVLEEARRIPNLAGYVTTHTRQLVVRLKRPGATLSGALHELAGESDIRSFRRIFAMAAEQVERGCSLGAALAFFPGVFPDGYLKHLDGLTGAGPASLLSALDSAADYMAQLDSKGRIRSSVTMAGTIQSAAKGKSRWRSAAIGAFTITSGVMAAVSTQAPKGSSEPLIMGFGAAATIGTLILGGVALRDARVIRAQSQAQNLVDDAWTSYAKGQTDKAAKELTNALTTARDGLGSSHLMTLSSLHSLANLHRQREEFGTADTYYQQSVRIYETEMPPQHPARGQLHFDWAQNYVGFSNTEAAFVELDKSITVYRANGAEGALELSEVLFYKGRLHFELKQDAQALGPLSEALEMQYELLGIRSTLVHRTLSYLTKAYVRQGRLKESEPHLSRLLAGLDFEAEPDYAAMAEANLDMGCLRSQEGRAKEAEPYFLRCLELLQGYVGPNEWLLERTMRSLRNVYGQDTFHGHMCQMIVAFMREKNQIRPILDKRLELLEGRDNTGWNLLQWAIFLGREDVVQLLLHRRIDMGYDASRTLGPMHVACAWNRQGALKMLLERGCDINAKGPNGWTPLFYCAFAGQQKLMEILLERGADVKGRDDNGRTALHLATSREQLRMVAALLASGAEVNAQEDILGSTPLHLAAERGHVAISECLTFNGANLALKDRAGQTAIDLARKNQQKLVERDLRKFLRQGFGVKPPA